MLFSAGVDMTNVHGLLLSLSLVLVTACGPTNAGSNSWEAGAGQHDAGLDAADDTIIAMQEDASCAAQTTEARVLPLDIYVMLDQSNTMSNETAGVSKWEAVTTAIENFIDQTGLSGVSMGIQFFGLTAPEGGTACLSSYYANPLYASPSAPGVEIASLPGARYDILNSIGRHTPGGETPTGVALEGAIDHCKTWRTAYPNHATIVLLATDGQPNGCGESTIVPAVKAAAAGLNGTPQIYTFVIGVGAALANLDAVAEAGGTTQAFIVDTDQDVRQQFLDALNSARMSALACKYGIPEPTTDGGSPDYTRINVQVTPGTGGDPQSIAQAPDKDHCPADGDGWYYDDQNNPTQILLCENTCSKVNTGGQGKVDILVGCQTIVIQ
jgi:hypothetical protein